jgi:hypothetical protein
LLDSLYFVVVGAYLTGVMVYLVLSGRVDPKVSLRRLIAARLRKSTKGTLSEFGDDQGYAFTSPLPARLISDSDGRSRILLYEDGNPLGPGHCGHDEVREKGEGRYSHWDDQVYFSASDNTSPLENERTYTYAEE